MHEESFAQSTSSSVPAQASFDRCLVDGDPVIASRGLRSRRKAFGISFVIETALLGMVVLLPLITSVAQPPLKRILYIPFAPIGSRRANPGAKPAPPNSDSSPKHGGITYVGPLEPGRPAQPIRNDAGEPVDPGPSGGIDVNGSGTQVFPYLHPAISIAPPPEEAKKNTEKRLVKLSEPVVQAQLISRVEPRYPALAVQIHLQGTVVLHAIISRDGRITSLEVVSGHPLLVQSALDSVRQWRYHPTILDGDPVEVETTISVIFQLAK